MQLSVKFCHTNDYFLLQMTFRFICLQVQIHIPLANGYLLIWKLSRIPG